LDAEQAERKLYDGGNEQGQTVYELLARNAVRGRGELEASESALDDNDTEWRQHMTAPEVIDKMYPTDGAGNDPCWPVEAAFGAELLKASREDLRGEKNAGWHVLMRKESRFEIWKGASGICG